MPNETMRALLDHHLASPEAKDGLAVVLTLTNGTVIPGAMRRGPVEGSYHLRTVGRKIVEGRPSNQLEPLDLYFTAESVHSFAIPVDQLIVEPPRIQLPSNHS